MPTVQSMELPKPKNWQDFETIVCDAQAQRWKSTSLQKNGRSGQKQYGVDIYGPDDIGRPTGIQCKRYQSLELEDVTDEITNAESFKGILHTLFIATTADYDAKLQQQVRLISEKRVAEERFAVGLLFWDDIVSGLILNPAVLAAHYPQITLPNSVIADKSRQIAALELGYFGADLWEYIELIYGEFGWLTNSDPDELIATLRILEQRAQQLLPLVDAAPIQTALGEIRTLCLGEKNDAAIWQEIKVHAERVRVRIKKSSSLLSLSESNVLDVGLRLGCIYHHSDDLPNSTVRKEVEAAVRAVLSASSDKAIAAKFASAKKLSSGYAWARRIYTLLDHELRYSL